MRSAIEGVRRVAEQARLDWPAAAKIYGTWGYAFAQACEEAKKRAQRIYVYRGVLDGKDVWVASLDPKEGRPRVKCTCNSDLRQILGRPCKMHLR